MSWKKIIEIEPRLQELYEKARKLSKRKDKDIDRIWGGFTGLKSELCRLVGYDMDVYNEVLCTSEAYEIAYRKIYNALAGRG